MLTITPTTLREANAYVAANHRHHQPVRGCIACVAVSEMVFATDAEGKSARKIRETPWQLVGVYIAGITAADIADDLVAWRDEAAA